MKSLKTAVAAAAVVLAGLASAPSHAALTFGTIPGGTATNDFLNLNGIGPVEGWYGGDIYLNGGPANLTIDYFGAEAGFRNSFQGFATPGCTFNHTGNTTFTPAPSGPIDSCSVMGVASGLLNFSFTSGGGLGTATNGSNPDNSADNVPNFFVTFANVAGLMGLDDDVNGSTPGGGTVAWLFFDDGGAGDDDNHDDMVVRISIANGSVNIPEPGTIALLGAALLGLGAARRRRTS